MAADPNGWCPFAERVEAQVGGYTDIPDDGMYCDAIVDHVAGGYIGGLLSMARDPNSQVSWHFSIGRDGKVYQHRSIADPAYHAGIVNQPTWKLYDGRNPNKRTVGIEHEGFSVPGLADYVYSAAHPWPEALIVASITVHQWVFDQVNRWTPGHLVPTEDTVITHSMLDARTRPQDPGDVWLATVRPRIITALQGGPITPPPSQPIDEHSKQVGRREMFDAWVREDERRHNEVVAASLAHLEWVKARESEWGIP